MATKQPTTKDLRAMPEAEMRVQFEKIQQELWQRRVKAREGSLPQTHLISAMRRQLARMHTILRERTS